MGLTLLLLASVGLNLLLTQRVDDLQAEIGALKQEGQLQEGDIIGQIEVRRLDGEPVVLRPTQPTVLYVLSPTCMWCARNVANVNALARDTAEDFEFIGLSLSTEGLLDHIQSSAYRFDVFTDPSATTLQALKVGGTPQTIVIDSHGRVLESWSGAFSNERAVLIEEFFDVRLPGLVNIQPETVR